MRSLCFRDCFLVLFLLNITYDVAIANCFKLTKNEKQEQANPNTPYLYTTLPLFSLDIGRWWPFAISTTTRAPSWLPSPMWRFSSKQDVAVFVGRLPPRTVYMGLTTFALWRPLRFVFASLGDSSNSLTLKHDPETGLFAYVICFANSSQTLEFSAFGAVMEALSESGLPDSAINVQALDPEFLASKWTYYELVMRIFHFENQTEGNLYLQSHNHDYPFYYVSAPKVTSNNGVAENQPQHFESMPSTKQWAVPSTPTGFKTTFHPKSIREKEKLAPFFVNYGKNVLSDLHWIFSSVKKSGGDETASDSSVVPINNIKYTNHSFGPLYVADGTNCLRQDTECLGGCPDAAYFGLNVGNETASFETLPSWPSLNEVHVVTLVDHCSLNNSVYGSLALLASSSKVLDPLHLTKNVRATSIGVTSPDLFVDRKSAQKSEEDTNQESRRSLTLPFAAWVFTQNPYHCKILSRHHLRYGCTVIDSTHLSSSNKYVTYLERIYLNPLTGTRPDYDSILPARLYRLFLEDESKKEDNPNKIASPSIKMNQIASTTANKLPFSKIKLPPSQRVETFDGDARLRFLHIIKTGGESLENYVWKEPSLTMDYGVCFAAATKTTNSSSIFHQVTKAAKNVFSSVSGEDFQETLCNALATLTSSALCGLNCECCASDLFSKENEDIFTAAKDETGSSSGSISDNFVRKKAFHGTLLRSPRAHILSQFSHCHAAHHTSWGRILRDVPLYAAEGILRLTEQACRSSCDVEGDPDWLQALETRLKIDERQILPYTDISDTKNNNGDGNGDDSNHGTNRVLVISIHNTQSHALTCGKSRGSFGHHFRRIIAAKNSAQVKQSPVTTRHSIIDEYTPLLQDATKALERFEWFGITELFMPSLCLLHYQANQELPPKCDCESPLFVEHDSESALGYWKETRSERRSVQQLTPSLLSQMDAHTIIDSALYSHAVRVFLGRLRGVEQATGASLLKCIQWDKFRAKTGYLTELWNDGPDGLLV